jgi:heme exporter protein D
VSFSDMFFGGFNGYIWSAIFVVMFLLYLTNLRLAELGRQEYDLYEKVIDHNENPVENIKEKK